jgi:S1-C subfamily serine protease
MRNLNKQYAKLINLKDKKIESLSDKEIINLYIQSEHDEITRETFNIDDIEYTGNVVGIISACDQEICQMLLDDGTYIYVVSNDHLVTCTLIPEEHVAYLIKKQANLLKKARIKRERFILYPLLTILIVVLAIGVCKMKFPHEDKLISVTDKHSKEFNSAADMYDSVKDSVIIIHTYDTTGESYGTSSGLIVTEDGYVVSCAHIYSDITNPKFKVITNTGERYETVFVAGDVESDVCLLKIINPDSVKFKPVTFANSDNVGFGDKGYILGFPGGATLSPIITEGLISAPNVRTKTANGYTNSCIQTDATANPGSSGGGLFDSSGRVIGLVTSKYAVNNYEDTIYCVPSTTIEKVVNRLFYIGYVSRPTLGITFTMTSEVDLDNGLPYGGKISSLSDGSALAGLIEIDEIITHVNGKRITLTYDFYDAVQTITEENPIVTVTIYNSETKTSREVEFKSNFRVSSSGYLEQ